MGSFKTEQESFWAGTFGNSYVDRNDGAELVAQRTFMFSKILERTRGVRSVLELGANVGNNLRAIKTLIPSCKLKAVEINAKAAARLAKIPDTTVYRGSIFDFNPKKLGKSDLTFTSGVLIHINPDLLLEVYERLHACSAKYVLISEYYNPAPVEVPYRGHAERLFKRDFAGEMLERYSDLELVDYGFRYRRDPNFPADDITWFLMKKAKA